MSNNELEEIMCSENLSVHFKTGKSKQLLKAVDNISLPVYKGEVLGLVGESGSGKSTFGRALLRMNTPSSGNIYFRNENITDYNLNKMKPLRKYMQMIFQDPNSSLNPRMKLKEIIREPLYVNKIESKKQQLNMVKQVLEHVQLPIDALEKYPSQLSGGQRQRVAIARAIVTKPQFIVADEPVSALDVSVQAQILNLLSDLRQELNLTILFISHDLATVEYFADRVAVMYLGRIVELGSVDTIFKKPSHPYTKALMESIPEPDPCISLNFEAIKGELPSPTSPPSGCVFRTRCPIATDACAEIVPELKHINDDHQVACIHTNSKKDG